MNSALEPKTIEDDFFGRAPRSDPKFEVRIGKEDIFVFQGAADASQLYRQRANAEDFANSVLRGSVSEQMKPYVIDDIRILYYVGMLSHFHVQRFRIVDGEKVEVAKFTQLDFLRLAGHNANYFDAIRIEVDSMLGVETKSQLLAEVEEAKKE